MKYPGYIFSQLYLDIIFIILENEKETKHSWKTSRRFDF